MTIDIRKKYKSINVVSKATIWFMVCSILQKGFVFFTTPIFTHLMNTEEYGKYSIYLSWVQIFLLITSLRLDYAVFNKGMSKYDDKDGYTLTMQTISSIISLIVFIIYLIFFNKFNSFIGLDFKIILLLLAHVFFMNAITFWTIKQRFNYKYISVVLVTLLITIFDLLFGVLSVMFFKNKGFWRIVSLASVNIIVGLIIYIYNIIKGKKLLKREYAIFAILFNLPLIPHYLSIYVLQQSDKIMIQKILGFSYVGLYSVAYSIANAVNILTNSINQSLTPWMYINLEKKNLDQIYKKLIKIFISTALLIILFIFIAPDLMRLVVSKEYYNSVYLIIPVSISVLLTLIYGFFATIEFYYDKNKFSMIISGLAAIINIILNYIFIPKLGYIFAGYSTMICYEILMIGHVVYTNKIIKNKENRIFFDTKTIFFLVSSTIIITIILNLLYFNNLFRYLLLIILLVILYFIYKKK